jgi:hypothetical protein
MEKGRKGDMMAEKEDVRKFREMLDECVEGSMKKLDLKKLPEEKKAGMIRKFKKLVGA